MDYPRVKNCTEINWALVRYAEFVGRGPDTEYPERYRLHFADGDTLQVELSADPCYALRPVSHVPALPGYFAVELTTDGQYHATPILAWRCVDGALADPVTLDCGQENPAILCPDGTVTNPCLEYFHDIQEWAADALEKRADERRARKAAKVAAETGAPPADDGLKVVR